VLCCLEGRSQEEAASILGCTVGSVKGRLERARARLKDRLARRGIDFAAAISLLALTGPTANASAPLLDATLTCARTPAPLPPSVSAWLDAASPGMFAGMRKYLVFGLLLVGVLVAGFVFRDRLAHVPSPPPPEVERPPAGARGGEPLPPGALARFGTDR